MTHPSTPLPSGLVPVLAERVLELIPRGEHAVGHRLIEPSPHPLTPRTDANLVCVLQQRQTTAKVQERTLRCERQLSSTFKHEHLLDTH